MTFSVESWSVIRPIFQEFLDLVDGFERATGQPIREDTLVVLDNIRRLMREQDELVASLQVAPRSGAELEARARFFSMQHHPAGGARIPYERPQVWSLNPDDARSFVTEGPFDEGHGEITRCGYPECETCYGDDGFSYMDPVPYIRYNSSDAHIARQLAAMQMQSYRRAMRHQCVEGCTQDSHIASMPTEEGVEEEYYYRPPTPEDFDIEPQGQSSVGELPMLNEHELLTECWRVLPGGYGCMNRVDRDDEIGLCARCKEYLQGL